MTVSLYSTAAWQSMRVQALARDGGKCRMCSVRLVSGRSSPRAYELDHIIPHKGDPKLFYDINNVQCLCKGCHGRAKSALERGKRMQRTDDWRP